MFYLPKDLEHDRGLTCAGVPDYLHVLCLSPLRYADHRLHSVRLDAYSIPSDPAIELLGRHHLWAFQPSSISQPFASSNVLSDRKRELDEKGRQTENQRELVEVEQTGAIVNGTFEVATQGRVDITLTRCLVKENIAAPQGRLGERKRNKFPTRFRHLSVYHVGVRRQSRWHSAAAHHKQPIVVSTARSDCACDARPYVDRGIKTL